MIVAVVTRGCPPLFSATAMAMGAQAEPPAAFRRHGPLLLPLLLTAMAAFLFPVATGTTHADLVNAVTKDCTLILDSDVTMTASLPDVNTAACPEVKLIGRCSAGLCKIDGAKKFSFIRNAERLHLENLEITRCRCGKGQAAAAIRADVAVIKNCRITHNKDEGGGGVVHLWEAQMTVENSVFSHNHGRTGGAIVLDSFSTLNATDVVFRYNTAVRGGAIENVESNLVCERCSFLDNDAQDGGAVYLIDDDGTEATFRDCQFVRNRARRRGGMGGAVYVGRIDPGAKFCNCKFAENSVTSGKTRQQVVNHVWIDIKSDDYGNVTFCPSKPASGIWIHPGFIIKEDCAVCTSANDF
ncbi:hypothetical protein CBR_g40660 [Chara braunii]|uniref:Right handed beta helix domain-containing protein n=1 Tax=Chara braunii TaxID=69332 RepID=A0A388LUB5_CHABU|nr:hypothetical protein CBR_g40660 [Chara braunii]|eukprot:GBG85849.1 hypothetical protein CBR_g40660 [Chara braunii]